MGQAKRRGTFEERKAQALIVEEIRQKRLEAESAANPEGRRKARQLMKLASLMAAYGGRMPIK